MSVSHGKPFSPIIGETYSGYMKDGTKVYIENVSHHPMVNIFLVISPNGWKITGYYDAVGKFKFIFPMNGMVKASFYGPNAIEFDNGQKITYWMPSFVISDLNQDAKKLCWEGHFIAYDTINKLKSKIKLDTFVSGGYFRKDTGSKD